MTPLLLALALTTQAPAENPADLAGLVASADPAAREEAGGRLEEIGRPALPALRLALAGADDPAAARRLAGLIDLIERKRLLRATPVVLDERGVSAAEAVADLGRRSGLRAVLDPADDPAWATRRVTLTTPGPVGFWDAVDRLGAAGGFRPDATSFWPGGPKDSAAVRLVPGGPSPIRPSYAGPYRVELAGLDLHRQAVLPKPGRTIKVADDFAATLVLAAEPGILLDRNGPPRLLEAVDDRGADLRPPPGRDPTSRMVGLPYRQWRPTLASQTYRVPLGIPASRGGTLKRLRGVLPVLAFARAGPLMTAPLGGIAHRPMSASGVTLTVRRLDRQGAAWSLQATVRGEPNPTAPALAAGPRQLTLTPLHPPFQPDDHVEILDDRGRPFLVTTNGIPTPRPDGSIEFTLFIHANSLAGPPSTLRYYGLVAEATEVPFSFEDVPMP